MRSQNLTVFEFTEKMGVKPHATVKGGVTIKRSRFGKGWNSCGNHLVDLMDELEEDLDRDLTAQEQLDLLNGLSYLPTRGGYAEGWNCYLSGLKKRLFDQENREAP